MVQIAFQPGDLIGGRYRLTRMIGAGAMGAVWSARNESTDRDFALKLMLPDAAQNPVALQRFFQEAKASGRLRHRCIVEVYDLGRIEQLAGAPPDPRAGTPYLVMELLEGEPLDSLLRRRKLLPIGTALRLVADVARGLDVAHKQGIVHRDLKPGNLFLHKTLEGPIVPKILDFGISKLVGPNHDPIATSAGTVLGSPAYMSPEQAGGEIDVDARSDVWSLGVMLYKCLSGTVPFAAANYNALMVAITRQQPPPIAERVPGLPDEIVEIVHRCLTKIRAERFLTAKALAETIEQALKKHPGLPSIDLAEIVDVPIELANDEMKTIAHERSMGTLAATEIDDQAETRALDSASLERPAAAVALPLERSSTEARAVAVRPRRRSLMAIAAGGAIVSVLATIAIVKRPGGSTASGSASPSTVLLQRGIGATATTQAMPTVTTATVSSPAIVMSPSASFSAAASTSTKPPIAIATSRPPAITGKTRPAAPPTKAANEGVTSSGL